MNKGTVSWYTSVISGILLCVFMLLYPHPPYEDKVAVIGDTLDYQTIAVNFAKRNVFPVDGLLLPDSAYHFKIIQGYPGAMSAEELHSFPPPVFDFVRNPLYPFFCGVVYKIWGVRPSVLFRIQFFLLVLSLAMMPSIGAVIAGWRGYIAGVICVLVAFGLMRQYALEVQAQALILPYTIGLWWILARYIYRHDMLSTVILGVYLGIGLLLKNFFIPVVIIACCYRLWHGKQLRTLLLPLVLVACILPYTFYMHQHRLTDQPFILLTDQGSDILMASNNDKTVDGDWHPEGIKSTPHYQRPDVMLKAPWQQVVMYIYGHPRATILNMSEKIRLGLLSRWPPVLFLMMLVGVALTSFTSARLRRLGVTGIFLLALTLVILYLFRRDVFYDAQRVIGGFMAGTGLLLLLLPLCYVLLRRMDGIYISGRHVASWILILGFLSLNMMFYGSGRIVGMIDFVWMFYAVLLGIDQIALIVE